MTASVNSNLLEVSGLNAWYGAAHILFDVALKVRRGEVISLPTGSSATPRSYALTAAGKSP